MLNKFSDKEKNYSLFGLVLGDGSYTNYGCIRIRHTNKQKFYIQWLEQLCINWELRHTVKYDVNHNTTFGVVMYSHINIWVPDKRHFNLSNRIYDENHKKIPSDYVLDRITPFGLLLWWLDDGQWHVSFKGNKGKRFGYLNTQSFSKQQNECIARMFKTRFDIDLKLHTDTSQLNPQALYYRLYFNATNFRKFYDIVRIYIDLIPLEFIYKFNMQYTPNRLLSSKENTKKYNCNNLQSIVASS